MLLIKDGWGSTMTTQASPPTGAHPTPPAPPAASPVKLRPSRAWYLVALAVFIAGVVSLVIGLVAAGSQVNSFQRVALPGQGEVTLDHSGGYVIYYEARGAASGSVPAFTVRMAPASASASVESMSPYTADVSYTFGSREGRAVLTVEITSPGKFLIEAPEAPAVAGGSALAIGSSIAGGIAGAAVAGALLMTAGAVGAIVIAIVRHRRAKRALAPPMQGLAREAP